MGSFIDNTLGTNIFGDNSTDKALAAQQQGTQNANQALNTGLQNQTEYLNPYNQAGLTALQMLTGDIGAGYQQSPGYQSQLAAGQTAINNGMAARGLGNSGAALKSLTKYSQDLADQDYQQYYNNEANRLNLLAGYGSNAANNLANASGNWAANTSNNYMGLGNAAGAANIAQGNQQANMLTQGIKSGTAALMFSDERLKKNITPIPREDIAEMKKILKAYYFNYKNDEYGTGDWAGIMAQDLEKSKLGRFLVVENEQGQKTIDQNKVLSMFLATMAEEAA